MGSAGAEKLNKSNQNLTELLFNGPAERAEMAEIVLLELVTVPIMRILS